MQAEVIVVGMGPVGAVVALQLARAGIDVIGIEAGLTIPEDLRASTIHPPTLEMLDDLGLAETLLTQGLKAPVYQYRDRGSDDIYAFDMSELADRTRYPFRLQCEQYKLMAAAVDMLRKEPTASVRFGSKLLEVSQDADGVLATVRDDQGDHTLRARYIVAADGASSIVRKQLDVDFTGFTYPEAYLCYSTQLPLEERLSGLCHVNYLSDPDEWLVLLRAPSAWRILLPVDDSSSATEMLADPFKDDVFRRLLGTDEPVETTHRTIYRIHQRVAKQFVVGRICLAGDSAHVNSPIGGYGMNSGIHDATNLSRALTAILRGGADEERLGHYDRQRRSIAHGFVQAQTMANTKAMREGWGTVRDEKRASMASILDDPARRRDFLLRQSMFHSIDQEHEIA